MIAITQNSLLVLLNLFGGQDWIIILLAIILLFGGKKIPELMKGIGKGVREFNDAKDTVKNHLEEGIQEKDKDQEIQELKKQMQQMQQQLQQKQATPEELPK
jgi:sec-independent protein translocase protein TatA